VCAGKPVTISAFGANTYSWNTLSNSQFITVNPTTNSTYSVTGTNGFGCSRTAVQNISVAAVPTVGIVSDVAELICAGEKVNLTGTGATNYQWTWNTNISQIPVLEVQPNTTTTYTLIGTDALGCTNRAEYTQNVSPCQGLNSGANSTVVIRIFPNPTHDKIQLNANGAQLLNIVITDISGRILMSLDPAANELSVDLSNYASGIYYLKTRTASSQETFRVVKN
jgi:hypothetical protein